MQKSRAENITAYGRNHSDIFRGRVIQQLEKSKNLREIRPRYDVSERSDTKLNL